MYREILYLVVAIVVSVLIIDQGVAGEQTVSGPEDFEIGSWHLNLSRRTFSVDEPGDGVIKIVKTTPDKEIRGGFLFLNWKLIPLRKFLRGDDIIIEKDVTLKGFNPTT